MTSGSSAIISPCQKYRYTLYRRIPQVVRWVKPCLFIMLNPSRADALLDDNTIRRCKGFANSLLCTDLTVVNMFALRATYPADLLLSPDPFGPDNERHLNEQLDIHWNIGVIIVAWGAHKIVRERSSVSLLKRLSERAHCLGMTKDGSPRHPLYVKADQPLVPWTYAA